MIKRLACSALLLAGCGSSSSTPVTTEPPTVAIVSLTPSSGAGWTAAEPTPARVSVNCDGHLVVGLEFSNWTARAPGACGEASLCGHSLVTLSNGATSVSAGAVSQPVLLELEEPAAWVGAATLEARLVRDDGSDYPGADGAPVSSSIEADLAASDCSAQ